MDQAKLEFLLDLVISKSVGPMTDPVDFILFYRLDEATADVIMDEVHSIADEVNAGGRVTYLDVLQRVGQ